MKTYHIGSVSLLLTAILVFTGCQTTDDFDSWSPSSPPIPVPVPTSTDFQLIRLRYDGQPWYSGLTKKEYIREFGRLSYEDQKVFTQGLVTHVDIHCGASLENLMKRTGIALSIPTADVAAVRKPERIATLSTKNHPVILMVGGNDWVIQISAAGRTALRTYCLQEGGTMVVSCGGPRFDKVFRKFTNELFPGLQLKEVPLDDAVFDEPYDMLNGSPRLWRHAGNKLMGLKKDGRWILFYHPGNINDAWKTGGMGATEDDVEESYRMGINMISYAMKD
jgi:hypothetical protein